jgi:hypothetical protein
MQPNSYYGFGMTPAQQSQSQPQQRQMQPMAVKPDKKHGGSAIIIILLVLICLGLGGFIVYDKVINKPAPEVVVEESSANISEPLSKVELPDDEEERDTELAKALVGRIFTADTALEQTLEFNSNVEYTFSYYKDPTVDYRKVLPSTNHGKFALKNNTISLTSSDRFKITNDYLIKTDDDLSTNQNVVYFDVQQLKTTYSNMNAAFNTYINNQVKAVKGSIAADRTVIDFGKIVCKIGDNHLTNADNYYCNVNYTIYVTKDTADAIVTESQKPVETKPDETKPDTGEATKPVEKAPVYKDFMEYCKANLDVAEFTKGGTCNQDYTINSNANIIVRINEDGYRVSGLFH